MRRTVTLFLALLIGMGTACSSSRDAATSERAPIAIVGSWSRVNAPNDSIHFLPTGDVMFEVGEILASINRFQNTQRARYISHLHNKGHYEWAANGDLVLYVTADWTGKGRGARRPTGRRVESRIVFDVDPVSADQITLRKKSLTQGDNENLNAEDEFFLTLLRNR